MLTPGIFGGVCPNVRPNVTESQASAHAKVCLHVAEYADWPFPIATAAQRLRYQPSRPQVQFSVARRVFLMDGN